MPALDANPRRNDAWRILLVALTLLTFSRLPLAEFVRWDDNYTLHHNPRLNPPSWKHLGSYWSEWQTGEFGLYMPVTYTVWSGLAWLARIEQSDLSGITLNPLVFHAANILIHTISVLLVFQILLKLIRRDVAALIGAALFAVHPVQVETVAWASGMKDLLGGMFMLAAVWQYLEAIQSNTLRRARSHRIAAIVLAALAMLSKPSAVMIGPICLALDVLLVRRSVKSALVTACPMLLFAIPIALIARNVQDVSEVVPAAIWARPLIAGDALAFYLKQIILPLQLTLDYGRYPQFVLSKPIVWIIWLIPAVAALAIWRSGKRELAAAGIVFVLALLPVLGLATFQFQQFSVVSDHYLYFAMLGVALTTAWIVSNWPTRTVTTIAGIIVLVLAGKSFAQCGVWHDDFILLPHAIAVNPSSFAAHNNLGAALEERSNMEKTYAAVSEAVGDTAGQAQHLESAARDLRSAADEYRKAIALKSDHAAALKNLAHVLRQLAGQPDRPTTKASSGPSSPGGLSQ